MKTKLTKLAFAALLVSTTSITLNSNVTLADQGGSAVGDLPGFGEDAYFGEDAAYTQPPAYADDQDYVDQDYGYQDEAYPYEDGGVQAVAHTQRSIMQPVSHEIIGSGCSGGCSDGGCSGGCDMGYSDMGSSMGCDGGCGDMGCSDMSCGSRPRLGSRLGGGLLGRRNSCNRRSGWGRLEMLGWWTQSQDSTPLIVRTEAGTLPALPDNRRDAFDGVVFGDDLNGEISAGVRGDVGMWLSENIGIGGRFWALAENNDSYFFQGNGDDQSIGRSFFNTDSQNFIGFSGGEDSLPIAFTGAGGPNIAGTISASSSLDLWATEGYARLRFGGTRSCRLDFIGGYSHFDIENKLNINSNSLILEGVLAGNYLDYSDQFNTENEFNGGQVGFEMVMNRGRWTASSLTKVHLGNMNQSATARGAFATGLVGAAPTTTLAEGILVGDPNAADLDWQRDVFSFVPEANFKLGYKLCSGAQLSVGYSFIYFDNVALAGDVIDRMVDGSALGTGGTNANGIDQDDSSLWVQGIDLGLTLTF